MTGHQCMLKGLAAHRGACTIGKTVPADPVEGVLESMEHMDVGQSRQTGWVKPTRNRTLSELQQVIAEKRAELALLEAEALSLREQAKLEAIAKARNIMRAHQLSLVDIEARSTSSDRNGTTCLNGRGSLP